MSDDVKERLADMLRAGVDASTWCREADRLAPPKPTLTVEAVGPSTPAPASSTIPPGDVIAFPVSRQQRSRE